MAAVGATPRRSAEPVALRRRPSRSWRRQRCCRALSPRNCRSRGPAARLAGEWPMLRPRCRSKRTPRRGLPSRCVRLYRLPVGVAADEFHPVGADRGQLGIPMRRRQLGKGECVDGGHRTVGIGLRRGESGPVGEREKGQHSDDRRDHAGQGRSSGHPSAIGSSGRLVDLGGPVADRYSRACRSARRPDEPRISRMMRRQPRLTGCQGETHTAWGESRSPTTTSIKKAEPSA